MHFIQRCSLRSSVTNSLQTIKTIAAVWSMVGGCVCAIGCGADATTEPTPGQGGDSTVGSAHSKGGSDAASGGSERAGGSTSSGGSTDRGDSTGGGGSTDNDDRTGGGGSVSGNRGGRRRETGGGANVGGAGNREGVGAGGNRLGGGVGGDAERGGAGGRAVPEGAGGGRLRDAGSPGVGGGSAVDSGAQRADGSSGPSSPLKKFFGNIDTRGSIRSDFKTMWDQFSPENAGKWGEVEKSEGSYNWKTLDAMYKYTQDNGIIFKEHTFCWGAQQPSWVNNNNGEKAVKAWMKAFCDRYPATAMIDVFNESLHNSPAYKNGIGGTGSSGYDWIANAFKWAKEACPKAILLYNDYNTIEYSNENNGVIKLVKAIKNAGAPIDGVGCQAHDVAKVSASTVLSYTQNIITQTGLPVYITEMDIGVADDNQQLKIMKDIVTPLWADENVKGFTYWGYIQGATWRSNTGLMSENGTKRPALTWLMEFLGR